MTAIVDHDGYVAKAAEAFRPALEHLRRLLADALPDADEMVAADTPGFRIDGTVVASYAAFTKQWEAPRCSSNGQALCRAHHRSKAALTPPWWYVLGLERRRRSSVAPGAPIRVVAAMDAAEREQRARPPRPAR